MTNDRLRRWGANVVVAAAAAGLTTSTAGRADSSIPVQQVQEVPQIDAEIAVEAAEPQEQQAEILKPAGEGEASYYGNELAGNRTASGERFNPRALTAAHRTLPLGSMLRVTNKANGKSVVVRVNDRGPFAKNRLIDVSLAAAERIQMVRAGKARVRLELIG